MKKIKNFFEKFIFFSIVLAQEYPPAEGVEEPEDLINIINDITRWLSTFLVVFSAIYFVMAGFNYVTSGGDENKVAKAKNQLLYGLVGIAIAALAFLLPKAIYHIVAG